VSARDLDKTFIGTRQDFVGVMDATVTLRSPLGERLDRQVIRFEWAQKKQEPSMPTLAPPAPTPGLPPLDPAQIAGLIKLGQDLLKHGDVESARFLLRRAAIAGNAQAALELGLTFDGAILAQSGVLGIGSDVGQAREWYERAIKLGSTEASRHLERLASMPK
jgi:TPR repeat protein